MKRLMRFIQTKFFPKPKEREPRLPGSNFSLGELRQINRRNRTGWNVNPGADFIREMNDSADADASQRFARRLMGRF